MDVDDEGKAALVLSVDFGSQRCEGSPSDLSLINDSAGLGLDLSPCHIPPQVPHESTRPLFIGKIVITVCFTRLLLIVAVAFVGFFALRMRLPRES